MTKNDEGNYLSLKVTDGVARLTLDRPPVNVLNIAMLRQLEAALEQLAGDIDVRVLVLTAAGKLFSAGVDVADHTADKVGEMIPLFDQVCRLLADFPVPTIAAVHGHALGGGCELVLCCDLAVMSETAKIGQPEILLAVIAPVAALRLPSLVGYRAAADLMFTGRSFGAAEAHQVGLVNAVTPPDQVEDWIQDKVGQLAPLSRSALIIAKRALRLGGRGSLEGWAQALPEMEALYLDDLMNTADAQEGLAAFMEKRSPTWKHE
jgi:cyclohexa-1,5-dienecarbonyl-CoA hydratase